ncbi:MAG: hypothetical protein RIQ93_1219 [Verrucomicrobiota bacterium]|jgi:hypothetical protein
MANVGESRILVRPITGMLVPMLSTTELFWTGVAAVYGTGLMIMVFGLVTAPEGHEDSDGFHSDGTNLPP